MSRHAGRVRVTGRQLFLAYLAAVAVACAVAFLVGMLWEAAGWWVAVIALFGACSLACLALTLRAPSEVDVFGDEDPSR